MLLKQLVICAQIYAKSTTIHNTAGVESNYKSSAAHLSKKISEDEDDDDEDDEE